MSLFSNTSSPRKRGFRNALIMAVVVGGIVYFQGDTFFNSLMALITTFAFVFPALWLSYRFTQKLMTKHQQAAEEATNSSKITTGQIAPDFKLQNQQQEACNLASYAGKNIVLYFYPKDDTPGCTIQAEQFTSLAHEFSDSNAVIVGISKDNCESHQNFIEKFNLNIELLADTDREACIAYGVWREKEKDGEKKMGILRSTFIINTQNEIIYAEYGVDPARHAQEMLDILKSL